MNIKTNEEILSYGKKLFNASIWEYTIIYKRLQIFKSYIDYEYLYGEQSKDLTTIQSFLKKLKKDYEVTEFKNELSQNPLLESKFITFISIIDINDNISFDGIDATGKGTLSREVQRILNTFKTTQRENIPCYTNFSGKTIKKSLSKKDNFQYILTEPSIDNMIGWFAINRFEVQKTIPKNSSGRYIFDRHTTSSVALTGAKLINLLDSKQGIDYSIKDEFYLKNEKLDKFSFKETLEKYFGKQTNSTIKTIIKYIHKIYTLEFEILEIAKPEIEIICTSKLNLIKSRISSRKELARDKETEDKDVHQNDAHEDQFQIIISGNQFYKFLLEIANELYHIKKRIDNFPDLLSLKDILIYSFIGEDQNLSEVYMEDPTLYKTFLKMAQTTIIGYENNFEESQNFTVEYAAFQILKSINNIQNYKSINVLSK